MNGYGKIELGTGSDADYDICVEWQPTEEMICFWDRDDLVFIKLTTAQMERLVQWWRENH